jgi:hypothetical protein
MSHSFEAVYGGGILSPGEFMLNTFNRDRKSDNVILLQGDLDVSTLSKHKTWIICPQKVSFLPLNSLIKLEACQLPFYFLPRQELWTG